MRSHLVPLALAIPVAVVGACLDWPSFQTGGEIAIPTPVLTIADVGTEVSLGPCKDHPNGPWSAPELLDVRGTGTSEVVSSVFLMADGLNLLFAADDDKAVRRLHLSTRATTAGPFGKGSLLDISTVTLAGKTLDHPAAVSLDEVLFEGPTTQLWVGTRSDAGTALSAIPYGDPVHGLGTETTPSISADGMRLAFSRRMDKEHDKLWEAARAVKTPGAPWKTATELAALNHAEFDVTCPALSPDGSTLFFATNQDTPGTKETAVYYALRRADGTFATRIPVPGLAAAGARTCPRAVSANVCDLYLVSDRGGTLRAYVAHQR